MDDLYLRLATILLYVGHDPRPLLMEALEEFPKGIWVHCVLAVLDLENTDPQIRARGQERMATAQSQAAQANKDPLGQLDRVLHLPQSGNRIRAQRRHPSSDCCLRTRA